MVLLNHIKKLGFILTVALVLVGFFGSHQVVRAATGGGTATIADTTGTPGVEGASAGVTAERATSDVFTVVLTISGSGMTLGAASPTFTVPTGFTAPNTHAVATAGDVNADGKWSVVSGTGSCVVDSAPGSLTTTATGQVITVDVTADCAGGDTITLTYKGTSSVTMGATAFTVSTADAGDPGPVTPLISGSPTVTVTDTIAPTVAVTMNNTALNVGDTALVTFTFSEAPTGFTVADVTSFPNGTLSAFTATGNPLVYTATFTPNVGINDTTNIITVGTAWTDAAGNSGVGGSSPNYVVNTIVAPGSSGLTTLTDTALTTPKFPNTGLAPQTGSGLRNVGIILSSIFLLVSTAVILKKYEF